MYPQSIFLSKNNKKDHLKIVISTVIKVISILHGHVFVMTVLRDGMCDYISKVQINIGIRHNYECPSYGEMFFRKPVI